MVGRDRGRWVRLGIAFAVFLVGVVLTGAVARLETAQAQSRADEQAQAVRSQAADRLFTGAEPTFYITHALDAFVRGHRGEPQPEEIQPYLAVLDEQGRFIRSISLAPGNRITYIEPIAGNEAALGLYFPDNPEQWPAVKAIIDGGLPVLVGPFDLVQGGQGLAYRLPILVNDTYWGLASTVIDANAYFANALSAADGTGVTIGIRVADAPDVLAGSPSAFTGDFTTEAVGVLGTNWEVGTVSAPIGSATGVTIRLIGWAMSIVLAVLVYLLIAALQRRREVSQRLSDLSDQVPGVLYQLHVAADGRTTLPFVSDHLRDVFGIDPAQLREDARRIWREFDPADSARAQDAMVRAVRDGGNLHERLRRNDADGNVHYYLTEATPDVQPDGSVVWHGFLADVSDEVEAEDQLRVSASVFASTRDAVVISDPQGRATDVNPAFTALTGFSREEILGRTLEMLAAGLTPEEVFVDLRSSLERHGFWRGEISSRSKDGRVISQAVAVSTVRDDEGEISHFVTVMAGLDSLRDDFVTGLPSRQVLDDRLAQAVELSRASRCPIALLVVGLDDFRDVNDALGHRVGDVVLREAGARLRSIVREPQTVARIGGDEFAIIVSDAADPTTVDALADECLRRLSDPYEQSSKPLHLTASIGIAIYPEDADSPSQLLTHANQALRVAKSQGRNLARYFTTAMQAEALQRASIADDLRRAVVEQQLTIVMQPVIELATGRFTKVEALLRWTHPERGPISPAVFIPVAERSGLIRTIGDQVFADVLEWLVQARRVDPEMAVSFNMSPVELHDDSSRHEDRLRLLARSGVPGHALVVEITEGVLVEQNEVTRANVALYRAAGVQFAIDDFGTGYSSLSYLQQLDVDYVKIDRAFVSGLPAGAGDRALCEAIVAMSHGLGLAVIAEGIETDEQRSALAAMKCDFAQGYLFARPMPGDEVLALLTEQRNQE